MGSLWKRDRWAVVWKVRRVSASEGEMGVGSGKHTGAVGMLTRSSPRAWRSACEMMVLKSESCIGRSWRAILPDKGC